MSTRYCVLAYLPQTDAYVEVCTTDDVARASYVRDCWVRLGYDAELIGW